MDSELKYEKASFGGITFCANQHGNEECGANGLPLTLNSTRVLGAFQFLKSLQHPHLASYLHLSKGKKERVFVISEHHDKCLFDLDVSNLDGSKVCHLFYQTISALSYLNEKGISHCFITPQSILINKSNQVLLSNYGLHHMTECGTAVSFPIGHPKYSSPESLLKLLIHKKDISKGFGLDSNDKTNVYENLSNNENFDQYFTKNLDNTTNNNDNNKSHSTDVINNDNINNSEKTDAKSLKIAEGVGGRYDRGHKGDVWSVSLVYLQLVMGLDLWKEMGLKELIKKILMFSKNKDLHPMDSILKEHNKSLDDLNKKWGEDFIKTLRDCLNLKPSHRPSADDLLRRKLFSKFANVVDLSDSISVVTSFQQFSHRELKKNVQIFDSPFSQLPQNEVFYLWTLAGGDMENTLKNRIDTSPPIFSLPAYIRGDGESFGSTFDRSSLFDANPVVLSLNNISNKLKNMTVMDFFPSFHNKKKNGIKPLCKLSYSVREKDFQYQFHRIVRMRRLLAAYPWHRSGVVTECSVDIPPLYRPHIWAVILNVQGDLLREYEMIDKDSPSQTDRQIEVDIPRCHQYNALLSSPAAHHKFKRILKAWVTRHQHQYVYWQGLDSLLAPFLYLHFNDEALAFACFTSFIDKYLHNFFYKDNSLIIQEYLAVFSHMISFHDPQLANHLHSIGFIPDLYSIPWFLTMYAHVFPLHNIFHLWDSLLMGDTSYPLCVGVAILKQLRKQLLSFGFNECILLFSDMPEIDMELCVQESLEIFKSTPKSCTHRKHSIHPPHFTQHSPPVTHLSRSDVPLNVIKAEVYPRISVEDLINFMALSSASAMLQGSCKAIGCENKKDPNKSVLVIDVRDRQSFTAGCIPTSFNVPFSLKHSIITTDTKNDALVEIQNNKKDNNGNNNGLSENLVRLLEGNLKNYIKVFVGECGKEDVKEMAEKAIKGGYNRVCVLDGGVEVMRTEGFLVPPSDMQLNCS